MRDTALHQENPQPFQSPAEFSTATPPVGIDIGGTKINAAIVVPGIKTVDESIVGLINAPTPTHDPDAFLNTLITMVQDLKKQQELSCVGIATAGVVDSVNGRILGSTGNLPALGKISNLKERLEDKLGLRVHIENDANAAAYGEWRGGAAAGARNMFAITLGTGVGMGIVFNGQMYRGSHFYAAEGGHIAISYHRERQCTCGRWDCWEAFASGNGLETTARLTVEAAPETAQKAFIQKYAQKGEVTTYSVIDAFKDNNRLGLDIIDLWHQHIAVGLGSLINVMDPDIIVVGGGLAQFVNFDLLRERTRERTMSNSFKLVPAELGNYAGIVGAAYLALESGR